MFGQLRLDLPRSISSSSRIRGRNRCIYSPRNLENQFHLDEKKDEIQAVRDKIYKIYKRLEVRQDLLGRGFCFGLLDPATNILINGAISSLFPTDPRAGGGGGGGQRKRSVDMGQRSLDGLVAFLTCIFPYLPDAEARGYLDAADADPFVALLLIINRRGMRKFDFYSDTTKTAVEIALSCAAVAANHPDPQWLVLGWKLLSPAVRELASMRSPKKQADVVLLAQKTVRDAIEANGISDPGLQLKECWALAQMRLSRATSKIYARPKELPPARAPMKRMLLATIHGFYLEALGRLPTGELRSRYHHSILMGGYCYGPLDPVSNIIVNTIWYSQNFPASKQFTASMISTSCLWRIVARSLYGLVTYLCTRYSGLTPDLAMQRLLVTRANLQAADPNLSGTATRERLYFHGCGQVGHGIPGPNELQHNAIDRSPPSASVAEAYSAAATAAFHPCPLAQSDFLGFGLSKLEFASEVLHRQESDSSDSQDNCSGSRDGVSKPVPEVVCVRGHGPLSSDDHELLCRILEKCPSAGKSHPQQDLAPTKIKKSPYAYKSRCIDRFWGQHERVSSMVKDALDRYNVTTVGFFFFPLLSALYFSVFVLYMLALHYNF